MTQTQPQFTAEFLLGLGNITAERWNALAGTDYPFLRHEFLHGLEQTGCVSAETGWQPFHLALHRDDQLAAVMPLYLKSHSYGEYVFDWSWADAWRQNGLAYYPKLLSAIPFTPATGPRLCTAESEDERLCLDAALQAVRALASDKDLSSWHYLFPTEDISEHLLSLGLPRREATQFHWFNDGFKDFDDFLATFNSRKRKSLKRERRIVAEQGLRLDTMTGAQISDEAWEKFYHFYQLTYAKRSGHGGYLTRDFFLDTAAGMGDQVVMVLAYHGADAVAGALYFRSSDTLYGRYWGCEREYDCLHFEACYYRGIEYCIEQGLSRFDPGAQGEHKIQRGFRPVTTWSNHWIADPRLAEAVADFTRREASHNTAYSEAAADYLPFRQADS
ncbi:MAG: GNAT family N-acetyltransferase [Halioglobus sp.]